VSSPGTARNWWSDRFIGMLESLGMGPQFGRGRRYARAGHVRHLTISASLVVALVRGSDDQTYRARIAVRAFSAADWARVERELARQAYYAAKLLAGQMPPDIDRMFARYGLSLFPDSVDDVAMDCSCPDWEVPCRHLAAACHVLAESFDTDPFGILAWRGRGRDELLDRLRELRSGPPDRSITRGTVDESAPLADSLSTFWTAGGAPARSPSADAPVPGTVRRPDALLDQLDALPLTYGRHEVADLLRPAYRAIVDTGED
jgi:uncharacterized Zn finger protein